MATITAVAPNFFAGAGYTPNITFTGTAFPTAPQNMRLTFRTTAGVPVEGVVGNFAQPITGQETTKCRGTLYCDGYTPPGEYVIGLYSSTLGDIPGGQPFTIRAEPVITTLTPTSGAGLGPHTLTVTGTNFLTTAYQTRFVLFIEPESGGYADIKAQSEWLTATATSFTAPITFEPDSLNGRYRVVMEVNGYGYSHNLPTFTYGFVAPYFIKEAAGEPVAQLTQAIVEYMVAAPPVAPANATNAVIDQAVVELLLRPRTLTQITQMVVETLHRPIVVPNIVGMDAAQAQTTLENVGLHVSPNSVEEYSDYPDNLVLYQTPAAGTIVGLGAAITVIVSKGQAPPQFQIKIGGVDRTTAVRATGSFRIDYSLGARTRCDFEVRDYSSTQAAYRPTLGDHVEIIAPPTLFNGAVVTVQDLPLGEPGVGTVTKCQAMDDWRLAAKRLVTQTYSAGHTLNQLVYHLWAIYLADYGIKLEAMSGTGPAVNEPLTFEQVTIEETFNRLALLTGWVYRLAPSNVLQWFAIGTKIAGGFSEANQNIRGAIEWTRTLGHFVNRVVLRYGSGTPERSDSFVGNGVTKSFKLTYPLAVAGWIEYPAVVYDQQPANVMGTTAPNTPGQRRTGVGVAMPGGLEYYPSDYPALENFQAGPWPNQAWLVPASQATWPAGWGPSIGGAHQAFGAWYWDPTNHAMVHNQAYPYDPGWPTKGNITPPTTLVGFNWYLALKKEAVGVGFKWHYDATTNAIVSDYPFAPPNGVAFKFTYNAQYPLILVVEDAADIAAHGISEALFEAPDIFEYAEAKAYAESQLRKGGQTPRSVSFTTTNVTQGFLPGDSVYLDVPERTLPNDLWLVTEVQVEIDEAQTFSTRLTLLEGGQVQGSWIDFWRNTLGGASSTWGTGSLPGASNQTIVIREGGAGEPVGEVPAPRATTTPAVVTMEPPHTPGRLVKWGVETNTITDVLDTDLGVIGGITELTGDVLAGPGKGPQAATLRSSAGLSVLGQPAFTAGPPIDITAPALSNYVLREQDGVLVFGESPGGTGGGGGVVGPVPSTPNAVAVYADATGQLLGDTTVTITSGSISTGNVIASDGFFVSTPGGAGFTSPTFGRITLVDYNRTGFDCLQFGGTTAAFPALKRSGTGLHVRAADDSGFVSLRGAAFAAEHATPVVSLTETTQPADQRVIRLFLYDQYLRIQALNDAQSAIQKEVFYIHRGTGATTVNGTLTAHGKLTVTTGGGSVTGQLDVIGSHVVQGNIHNSAGYLYPGRYDAGGGFQGSWILGSHGSYGLFCNTGLRAEGSFYTAAGVFEGNRGTAMGYWIDIPYNPANFAYFTCGAQTTFCYMLLGKTLTLVFELNSITVPAVTSEMQLLLPAGLTASRQGRTLVQVVNVSTNAPEVAFFTAGGNVLRVSRFGGNWQVGSGNTAILGHAIIPVN